jgi:hypothetical protein
MAAKEISVKKYVVRLSGEERERLETLIRKAKSPASLTAPPSPPSIYKGLSASVQKTAYYSTPVLG